MENLDKLFSREDILRLIELADGTRWEDVNIKMRLDLGKLDEAPDSVQKMLYLMDNGRARQKLVAEFGKEAFPSGVVMPRMQIVLDSSGELSLQNFGDCRFRLDKPLEAYELVLRRMRPELFKNQEDEDDDSQESEYDRGWHDSEQGIYKPDGWKIHETDA